jgi:lipoprotein-releasing system permease protein
MLLALAITTGFQYTIQQKIFSFWGHIKVQHFQPTQASIAEELPIKKNDTVANLLRQNAGVSAVNAYATKAAILKSSETIEGSLVKGIDAKYNFNQLQPFLQSGRWLHFPDSGYSNEIVLSTTMASKLQLHLNDALVIYFIQSDGSTPRARKLTVTGIYKTGIEEYDKVIALADIRLIQKLNSWRNDEIGGYEIFLKDYHQMNSVNESIFYQLPSTWNSKTLQELQPGIFDWLRLQDTTVLLVLIIMALVAVLNLITCLIILVLERTKMVGLLKAVGASNTAIRSIFLYHGTIIASTGIIIGNVVAWLLCSLQQRYGWLKLNEEMYYVNKVVVKPQWQHFVEVNIGTLLVCLLALLIPTLIVKRISVVKAIQFR